MAVTHAGVHITNAAGDRVHEHLTAMFQGRDAAPALIAEAIAKP